MKGFVDKDTCIGCGLCPDICPKVFHMDEDGKAVAIKGDVPDGEEDSAKEAEESCPANAISVE